MKYLFAIFAFCASLILVSGQFFGSSFGGFSGLNNLPGLNTLGGYNNFGLRSLTPDYNGASLFAGGFQTRDPRNNRGTGPVVFPSAPVDAPVESSGVIVGASGYGFVPPQNQYRSRK